MILINYPVPQFRVKKEEGVDYIFDTVRRKWLVVTPEEWVRQNFVSYLLLVAEYPATLVSLEKELSIGELHKRFDILVYDRSHNPWLMVECKGREVPLTSATLEQIVRYNIGVPVKYLVITNGNFTYAWERRSGELHALDELPTHE